MNVKTIVLAGGQGSRFSPFDQNKTVFPFFGRPLVSYQISALLHAGFENITLVVSKETHNVLFDFYKNEDRVTCVVQQEGSGMVAAVLSGVEEADKSLFIVNALDFVDRDLFTQCKEKFNQGYSFIVGKKMKSYFPGGYLSVDDKQLKEIIEKPGEGNEPSDLVNLVFHFFADAQKFVSLLKSTSSQDDDVYEKALDSFAKEQKVSVIEYDGGWNPVKYGHHIINVTSYLLSNHLDAQNQAAHVSSSAIIDDNVFLGKGVKVFDGAVIRGPSYIGDNTIIGNNALVVNSCIEANSVVGYNSEVTRSYLGENTWLHTNYVGDSVLERDVSFGCRATTANFRLDQKSISTQVKEEKVTTSKVKFGALMGTDVRLGIQASTMPGVAIASGSRIGPGTIVKDSLAEKTTIYVDQQQKVVTKK